MERILANTSVYAIIGSFLRHDDRFRVSLTALSATILQLHYQDRQQILFLWAAWLNKTPSPEVDWEPPDDNYDAPPTPPSDSPVRYSDFYLRDEPDQRDRDPDSPFSDPLAELTRQDDCWSC